VVRVPAAEGHDLESAARGAAHVVVEDHVALFVQRPPDGTGLDRGRGKAPQLAHVGKARQALSHQVGRGGLLGRPLELVLFVQDDIGQRLCGHAGDRRGPAHVDLAVGELDAAGGHVVLVAGQIGAQPGRVLEQLGEPVLDGLLGGLDVWKHAQKVARHAVHGVADGVEAQRGLGGLGRPAAHDLSYAGVKGGVLDAGNVRHVAVAPPAGNRGVGGQHDVPLAPVRRPNVGLFDQRALFCGGEFDPVALADGGLAQLRRQPGGVDGKGAGQV